MVRCFIPSMEKKFSQTSKHNVVEGVILCPKGKIELSFVWGIGSISSNQVEAYALLQGLMLTKEHHFYSLIVVGDFKLLIHHIVFDSLLFMYIMCLGQTTKNQMQWQMKE